MNEIQKCQKLFKPIVEGGKISVLIVVTGPEIVS